MKANLDKFHVMCSIDEKVSLNISNEKIRNNKCLKLLSVNIEYRLTFDTHMNEIRKISGRKLNALLHSWIFVEKEN